MKKGEELPEERFPEIPEEELFKKLPEVPFEIKMITAAPFFHVSKQKGVELFSASLENVEKTLKPKQHTDPATKLFPELHELFELFSHQEANELPPHRLYDHKIKFTEGKQPGCGFLYSMSQGELQILKKNSRRKFNQGLYQSQFFFQPQPQFYLLRNQEGVSVYAWIIKHSTR